MKIVPEYQDKEWLYHQYIDLKRKVVDIAKHCKCSRKTINLWLRKFGFPKRKKNTWNIGKTDYMIGENNHNWKGDNVGYHSLHRWVKKYKIKPKECQHCGKEKKYLELANISGEYKRDINDYVYLCMRCHKIMDGNLQKFIIAGMKTRLKQGHKNELKYGVKIS